MSKRTLPRLNNVLTSLEAAEVLFAERIDSERSQTAAALMRSAAELVRLEIKDATPKSLKKEEMFGNIYLVGSYVHASQCFDALKLRLDEQMYINSRIGSEWMKLRGLDSKTLRKVIFALAPSDSQKESFEDTMQMMGFRVYNIDDYVTL